MRFSLLKSLLSGVAMIGLIGCDVDVEDEGEMPTMQVDPGRAPDVDVHGPDVDVNQEERTVTVPDVDINSEERKITVPDVDINAPAENDN